eukprot:gene10861-16976_t
MQHTGLPPQTSFPSLNFGNEQEKSRTRAGERVSLPFCGRRGEQVATWPIIPTGQYPKSVARGANEVVVPTAGTEDAHFRPGALAISHPSSASSCASKLPRFRTNAHEAGTGAAGSSPAGSAPARAWLYEQSYQLHPACTASQHANLPGHPPQFAYMPGMTMDQLSHHSKKRTTIAPTQTGNTNEQQWQQQIRDAPSMFSHVTAQAGHGIAMGGGREFLAWAASHIRLLGLHALTPASKMVAVPPSSKVENQHRFPPAPHAVLHWGPYALRGHCG